MPRGSETNGTNTSKSVNSSTVTLPQEEVLRLTTLQDDETTIETPNEKIDAHHHRRSRTASASKSSGRKKSKHASSSSSSRTKNKNTADFERETPKRTKSGGSTGSRKLKRAVKNEKKSVDSIVAAAIRKYEESPSTPQQQQQKTRTAPPRTKSGSSAGSKKKKSSISSISSSSISSSRNPHKNSEERTKGRKKPTAGDLSSSSQGLELAAASRSSEGNNNSNNNSDTENPLDQQEQESQLMDRAGAIAVFPTDSDHATTRRSISNPHRISDADEIDGDEEAQITMMFEEEIPEPPQSQVIHAVATYQQHQQQPQPQPSPFLRRSISEAQSASTLGTAPTISTGADEAGTVTARAVSTENYYAHVRQQLREEAVAAVAVVPLNEDGRPMENNGTEKNKIQKRGLDNSRNDGDGDDDDSCEATKEGRRKKVWMCFAIVLLVMLIAIIASVVSNRIKRRSAGSNEPIQQDGMSPMDCNDQDCMEDMMETMNSVMDTEMGDEWRSRITRILPKKTLVNILDDPTYTSPQYKAFYYIVANCDKIFGFTMRELMEMEFSALDTSRVTTIFGLVTLYEATKGREWYVNTNWLEPMVDICEWHGVNCDGEPIPKDVPPQILSLDQDRGTNVFPGIERPPPGDLDDDGLTVGEEEEGDVSVVQWTINDDPDGYFDDKLLFQSLDLQSNNLSGSIPEEISLLSNIYGTINLSNNNLGGSIPNDIGELSKLQGLRLDRNDFRSNLPLSLGQLTELRVFDVSHNKDITGDVAELEWSWPDIQFLKIERTGLDGTIPDAVCDMLDAREFTKEFFFTASCSSQDPQVDCPCCTHCCGIARCEPNT